MIKSGRAAKTGKGKLLSVITAWYDGTDRSFEEHIPLLWTGRHNRQLGSANKITLVFLEGMNRLSPSYLSELKTVGYTCVDAEPVYLALAQHFATLDQFGSYEKHCFLRWLVLARLYPTIPIIHYDGDIVWQVTPEKIGAIMRDKTLVLDGCPAFTVINDHKWYRIYEQQLTLFATNTTEYGLDWEGTIFRQRIGSDQDLLNYLISRNMLPQDQLPTSPYLFVENPLTLSGARPANLAFWHMQSDFIHYLNLHAMLAPYHITKFTPNPLSTPRLLLRLIYLLGKLVGQKYMTRRQTYHYWFDNQNNYV